MREGEKPWRELKERQSEVFQKEDCRPHKEWTGGAGEGGQMTSRRGRALLHIFASKRVVVGVEAVGVEGLVGTEA